MKDSMDTMPNSGQKKSNIFSHSTRIISEAQETGVCSLAEIVVFFKVFLVVFLVGCLF